MENQANVDVHAPDNAAGDLPPPLEQPTTAGLPPVSEALRRAAEVRAEAEAHDQNRTGFTPHPNVNTSRRYRGFDRADDINLDGHVDDDLGASFVGDNGFPDPPPPWLAQVINAAVTAAATAVAALPQQSAAPRSSLAPTKLSDRKVPDFWESKPEECFRIFDAHFGFLQSQ